ncbi:MAG: hypothetical protein PVH61_08890 [Candidatus Aminicenantes bacterium]|jgi:tetratricopeptide (TPR) repeat protein
MNQNFDIEVIVDFLRNQIGDNLERFCDHQIINFEKLTNNQIPLMEYVNLEGDRPYDKSMGLVKIMKKLGYLAYLIFYLKQWWIKDIKGDDNIFHQNEMPNQLCIAGQELWLKEDHRYMAINLFDFISKIHGDFKKEWQETKSALEGAPSLGPLKKDNEDNFFNLDEFIGHLKNCRGLYNEATHYRESRNFKLSRNTYLQLEKKQPNYSDTRKWLKIFENEEEIRKLQTLIDTQESGFAYDYRVPWETVHPYRLFRELGAPIKPASSNETVRKELQKLKERDGGVSKDKREILEKLVKNTDDRLLVDAFIYPVCPSEETVSSLIDTFFQAGYFPPPETIRTKYPSEAAVLLVFLEKHQEAEDIWKKALYDQPFDGHPVHCLGLLYLGLAYSKADIRIEKRVEYWQAAIAHWAVALANTAYWMKWGRQRFGEYKTNFVPASIKTLMDNIRSYLNRLLDTNFDFGKEMVEQSKKLKLQLNIEFKAVHLSTAMGGISLGEGRFARFGPLWMKVYALDDAVAKYIAHCVPRHCNFTGNRFSGNSTPEETLRRLRWYFSYLSIPAILVEGPEPNPAEALKILEKDRKQEPDCHQNNCPVHGKTKYPLQVQCPFENQFKSQNPAYKKYKEKLVEIMCEDALQLAILAHSELAKIYIRTKESDNLEKVKNQWKEILQLANHSKNPENVREGFCTMVLEVANPITKDEAGLDAAIKITEIGCNLIATSQALKTHLAELLYQRGLKKISDEDVDGAEANLRRALQIAPHLNPVRINLATLLGNQSILIIKRDPFLAQDYLRQAEELIEEGQKNYKGYDYSKQREFIDEMKVVLTGVKNEAADEEDMSEQKPSKEFEKKPEPTGKTSDTTWLFSQGIKELGEGKPDIALNTFEQALGIAPDDKEVQAIIPKALMEQAMLLTEDNRHEEALNLVKSWLHQDRLPTQKKRLERQLKFLEWWPYTQPCLEDSEDFIYKIDDYQEVQLWFPDKIHNNEFLCVYIQVEEDYLSLNTLIPLLPDAEKETGLLHLLQVSGDTMFKLSNSDKSELSLSCWVPFRLLAPGWFQQTAFDLFQFSDITSHLVLNREALSAQFLNIKDKVKKQDYQHQVPVPASARVLKKICTRRKLKCYEALTDCQYQVEEGRFEVNIQANGIRFFTILGPLNPTPDRKAALIKLVNHNSSHKQCKLALDDNLNVVLSIEFPYLDERAVSDALDLLGKKSLELKPVLTK